MSDAASAFKAAQFAARTKKNAQTKRQARIERRKEKVEKIQKDLKETKDMVGIHLFLV